MDRVDVLEFQDMNFEDKIKKAEYFIEGTDFERFALRERWTKYMEKENLEWHGGSRFNVKTIGHIDDRPVAVQFTFDVIGDSPIVFYEATSQLVDWVMIDKWLDKNCLNVKKRRKPKSDTWNFGACLVHCIEKIEKKTCK